MCPIDSRNLNYFPVHPNLRGKKKDKQKANVTMALCFQKTAEGESDITILPIDE